MLPFEKSLRLLIERRFPFEVRTTVHSDLIDENQMKDDLVFRKAKLSGNYYIQHFVNGVTTLEKMDYSNRELEQLGSFDFKNKSPF